MLPQHTHTIDTTELAMFLLAWQHTRSHEVTRLLHTALTSAVLDAFRCPSQ
eukprot:m.74896 g.74896  ORF g.74896 m.74896 type:complete len:51 (+) comp12418_c0_seq2:42-194(+)